MEAKSKIWSLAILAQAQRSILLATGLLCWCFARSAAWDKLSLRSHISAIKAFGPKLTSCKRGHRGSFESFERSDIAHACIQLLRSQGLLIPQPIALQRANCLWEFVCLCSRFFGWCHLSLACFCDVVQLNSYLFAFQSILLKKELAEFDSWK